MPPRKNQVYGKRSARVYSNFTGFTSPVKSCKKPEEITVVEVAEELERLTVYDAAKEEIRQPSPTRNPLTRRDGNTVVLRSRSSEGKSTNKSDATDRKQTSPVGPQSSAPLKDEKQEEENAIGKTTGALEGLSLQDEDAREPTQQQKQESLSDTVPTLEETITVVEEPQIRQDQPPVTNIFTKHVASLLSLSSRPLESFTSWSDQLSSHFSVKKIAEASFGEVYRLSLLRPHPTLGRTDESVLKIIALKPPKAAMRKLTKTARKRINDMSDPEDVASEVRLMQRMTTIPGYTMFRECCILQGRPGESFVSAWHDWNQAQEDKGKDTSLFPDPGKKASYNEDQLWAVIEMQGSRHENMLERVDD